MFWLLYIFYKHQLNEETFMSYTLTLDLYSDAWDLRTTANKMEKDIRKEMAKYTWIGIMLDKKRYRQTDTQTDRDIERKEDRLVQKQRGV